MSNVREIVMGWDRQTLPTDEQVGAARLWLENARGLLITEYRERCLELLRAYEATTSVIEDTTSTHYTIARWIDKYNNPNSKWLWVNNSPSEIYADSDSAVRDAERLTIAYGFLQEDGTRYFAVKITETRKVEAVPAANKIENSDPHSPLPTVIK